MFSHDTIYMDAALKHLRAEGFDVRAQDVARLSPLGFDHVNRLGRYAFILPDEIACGGLRPLRDHTIADRQSLNAVPVPFLPDPQLQDQRRAAPLDHGRQQRQGELNL
nr:Tn3 family transposase [uncultured Lichenicoccus sp.]